MKLPANNGIRPATEQDVAGMLAVYTPYVEKTAITFEYDVPSTEDFLGRFRQITQHYPWLTVEQNGQILGYAYATAFHPRAAYAWCAELAIYLRTDCRGQGWGGRLYSLLENILAAQHLRNLYTCVAYPDEDDEYLTHASIHFHRRMGFRPSGVFPHCGFKFQRWYNMVWLEKILCDDQELPLPILPFSEVREQFFPSDSVLV